MTEVKIENNSVRLVNVSRFDLADTLDCGQAFRWSNHDGIWCGIAYGKYLKLYNDGKDIVIEGASKSDYDNIWCNYFDLKRDYDGIVAAISDNAKLKEISDITGNIRILRQEPWETLCSFIISQNNNIPRIKGIIERLCENFGDKIEGGYAFPSAEKIAKLPEADLAPLRCGFRAKYIIDAARKVANGEVDLYALCDTDTASAAEELMKIKGVGPKVAACTLLFGCGHISSFPVDVWIKRAMQALFSDGLPEVALPYAGIVQQYIFHYARLTKLEFDE